MTGFTLPGMIELPGCSAGRAISARPAAGPEPRSRRSPAILWSERATTLAMALASTTASCADWASKWSTASERGRPMSAARMAMTPRAKPGRRVEAGPDRRAAEGELAEAGQHVEQALAGQLDLAGPARRLLAEGHRRGVHQVGAPGLDGADVGAGQPAQLGVQVVERGDQLPDDHPAGGQPQRGREHVVRRLGGVDVVVGVHRPAEPLGGHVGQHLVGVHVGARAGAGLEDVEREVVVERAEGHLGRGVVDRRGDVLRDHPEAAVDRRRHPLDRTEGVDQLRRHPLAGDREVLDGPLRLRAPPGRDRDAHLAQRVVLDPHLPFVVVGGGRRSGGGGHGRHATAGPSPRDTVTACRSSNTRTSSPSGRTTRRTAC